MTPDRCAIKATISALLAAGEAVVSEAGVAVMMFSISPGGQRERASCCASKVR